MRTRREHCFVFGPFRLEPEEGRLLRDGLLVPLTPKAFAMLLVLVSHSGRLVGEDVLMQELWPDAFVEEGNLTFTMSVLRKALGDSARIARYIETVPKRGYRFIAPVREIDVKNPVKSVAVLPFLNLGSAEGSEAAQEVLHQMKTLASRGYVSPYDWAVLHIGLDENGVALRYLEQALKERSPRVIWLNVEPAFDSLRANRRFQNIIRRLGLE